MSGASAIAEASRRHRVSARCVCGNKKTRGSVKCGSCHVKLGTTRSRAGSKVSVPASQRAAEMRDRVRDLLSDGVPRQFNEIQAEIRAGHSMLMTVMLGLVRERVVARRQFDRSQRIADVYELAGPDSAPLPPSLVGRPVVVDEARVRECVLELLATGFAYDEREVLHAVQRKGLHASAATVFGHLQRLVDERRLVRVDAAPLPRYRLRAR